MFIVSNLVLKRREAYIECVPSTGLPHLICCLIKSLKSFLILQKKQKKEAQEDLSHIQWCNDGRGI